MHTPACCCELLQERSVASGCTQLHIDLLHLESSELDSDMIIYLRALVFVLHYKVGSFVDEAQTRATQDLSGYLWKNVSDHVRVDILMEQ